MAFEVQRIQPEDDSEIVELLNLVFNGWPQFDLEYTPLEHWRWKFLDKPQGKMISVKTVSDGNIVGCYHGVEMNVKIGEDLVLSSNGVDVAVHPDYRRMGMYSKMNAARLKLRVAEGARLGVWTSGNPILIDHQINPDSFVFPKPLARLVRIRDIDLHLKQTPTDHKQLYKTGHRIIQAINRAYNMLKPDIALNENIQITEIKHFGDKIDEFWEKVSASYSYIMERDKTFLNWRYCDPRGGEYHVCIAEEEENILGFCVYRINKKEVDYPQAYIIDLLTLPRRRDVREILVKHAVDYIDKSGINIIRSLNVKDNTIFRTLKKFGFVDSRMEQYVAVSPRAMTANEVMKLHHDILTKKLHFVYGDFDTI
jgi:GNAT superfamily N-acetyltransferase